jgi:hypothetical protein
MEEIPLSLSTGMLSDRTQSHEKTLGRGPIVFTLTALERVQLKLKTKLRNIL